MSAGRRRDQAAPYLAALASLLAAATVLPVVSGAHWAWESLPLVALVVGAGMILRSVTRSPGLVVLGQSVAGLLGLTVFFARSDAVLGFLPGPEAVRTMGALAHSGLQATRQFSTPAPEVPGITFLLVTGVVAVAIAVDALAVTWGMAVAAGLPLLVLYCIPAAVLPHGASAFSFALVAGGWLILLGHDGRLRVNDWGRVLRQGPDSGRRRFGDDDLEMVGASARRLGVITVVAAIAVPLLLPSLSNGLIDPTSSGGNGNGKGGQGATSVDPILTLKQNLTSRSTASVLTYTTTQKVPSPLRLVTDDVFDGSTWRTSDGRPSSQQDPTVPLPKPIGLQSNVSQTAEVMKVKVGSLTEGYLPVPYPATKVDVKGDWVYAPNSLDIVGRGASTRGLNYTVDYLDVEPTAALLEGAPPADLGLIEQYTQLPSSLPASIRQTAEKITAKASTPYDKAVALQAWFRTDGGFTYDTNVVTQRNVDAVSSFLTSKHGYCVQFSSAMAVMARLLGIPARIGVGFLPGSRQSNGSYSVSLNDAHAWPELYFEGVGWVRFEPTPAVRTGAPPAYSQAAVTTTPNGVPNSSATASSTHDAKNNGLSGKTGDTVTGTTKTSRSPHAIAGQIPVKLWTLIGLVLVGALATPVAAVLARRRRRRRARDAVERVEAAWAELLDGSADLGLELPTGATPRQIEERLAGAAALGQAERDALARLVRQLERARYAARPTAPTVADDPRRDAAIVLHGVRASCDRAERLRARILPRSGTEYLLGLSSRAGERLAGVDRRIARTSRSIPHPPTHAPSREDGPGGQRPRRRRMFHRRSH